MPTGASPTAALVDTARKSRDKQVETLIRETGYSSPADPVDTSPPPPAPSPPSTDPRDRLVADGGDVKLATPHPAFDAPASPTRQHPAPGVEAGVAGHSAGEPAKGATAHPVFDEGK